jgi:hypothetical protein
MNKLSFFSVLQHQQCLFGHLLRRKLSGTNIGSQVVFLHQSYLKFLHTDVKITLCCLQFCGSIVGDFTGQLVAAGGHADVS